MVDEPIWIVARRNMRTVSFMSQRLFSKSNSMLSVCMATRSNRSDLL